MHGRSSRGADDRIDAVRPGPARRDPLDGGTAAMQQHDVALFRSSNSAVSNIMASLIMLYVAACYDFVPHVVQEAPDCSAQNRHHFISVL